MRGYAWIYCAHINICTHPSIVCVRIYAQSMRAYICAYSMHIAHTLRIYARIFNLFLADTDAYLADGYGKYARIFGMRGNPK